MRAYVIVLGVGLLRLVLKGLSLVRGMTIRAMSWPLTVLILGVMTVSVLIQAAGIWTRFA